MATDKLHICSLHELWSTRSNGYRLRVRFEDGVEGVVDLKDVIQFSGVFAPLKEPDYFAQVRVNEDTGTICWPNDADLDPDVLSALVTGEQNPSFDETDVPATG